VTTYIGLLRAVNLAGLNRVSMADLRDLLAKLGMKDGQTLLQSGNVVFRSGVSSATKLEALLQAGAEKNLRLKTEFFVRSASEWKDLVAANPFPSEARSDPGHLLVMCLKAAPERAAVTSLQETIVGREVVKTKGTQAYIVYPDGIGRSRLTVQLIEKKLGTRGTGRNWNTVLKLNALAEATSGR
jgi:uncharacterized protein (DUF1697 family)